MAVFSISNPYKIGPLAIARRHKIYYNYLSSWIRSINSEQEKERIPWNSKVTVSSVAKAEDQEWRRQERAVGGWSGCLPGVQDEGNALSGK
jgi:hypothetical protein